MMATTRPMGALNPKTGMIWRIAHRQLVERWAYLTVAREFNV